jgi:hypothetical protein
VSSATPRREAVFRLKYAGFAAARQEHGRAGGSIAYWPRGALRHVTIYGLRSLDFDAF